MSRRPQKKRGGRSHRPRLRPLHELIRDFVGKKVRIVAAETIYDGVLVEQGDDYLCIRETHHDGTSDEEPPTPHPTFLTYINPESISALTIAEE